MRKFEVKNRYHGECTYIVEASSPEEAERIGRRHYDHGEEPCPLPQDWEQIQGSTANELDDSQ